MERLSAAAADSAVLPFAASNGDASAMLARDDWPSGEVCADASMAAPRRFSEPWSKGADVGGGAPAHTAALGSARCALRSSTMLPRCAGPQIVRHH